MTAAVSVGRVRIPRGVAVALAVALAVGLAALAGGRPGREGPPLDPRSDAPLGTSALVTLLERLDARVELSAGLPQPGEDVALVLADRLDAAQVEAVATWVQAGGTLVVADPSSAFAPPPVDPGVEASLGAALGTGAEALERGRCDVEALATIGSLEAGAAVRYEVTESVEGCFGDSSGAFLVTAEVGSGQVVALGGAALWTNDLLDEADNSVLAAALLAPRPGVDVRFVDPPIPAGGGTKTLGDLVSPGVKRALVQLGVAFALYAIWRAVRLGRPVPDPQPVEVAGSELVAAVGRVLSRTGDPGFAAETLRAGLRRELRARLAVPAEATTATLAALAASRCGLEVDDVLAAIDERPVTTDAELVAVARAAATVHQEVLP